MQSSSLVSQFKPYQWKLQRHEYDPSTNDGSLGLEVESVHCPWFWHGIEAQAAGAVAGGGGGVTPPPHVADWHDAGHSTSIVVPGGSGGFSIATMSFIISELQVEQGPRLAVAASSNWVA